MIATAAVELGEDRCQLRRHGPALIRRIACHATPSTSTPGPDHKTTEAIPPSVSPNWNTSDRKSPRAGSVRSVCRRSNGLQNRWRRPCECGLYGAGCAEPGGIRRTPALPAVIASPRPDRSTPAWCGRLPGGGRTGGWCGVPGSWPRRWASRPADGRLVRLGRSLRPAPWRRHRRRAGRRPRPPQRRRRGPPRRCAAHPPPRPALRVNARPVARRPAARRARRSCRRCCRARRCLLPGRLMHRWSGRRCLTWGGWTCG